MNTAQKIRAALARSRGLLEVSTWFQDAGNPKSAEAFIDAAFTESQKANALRLAALAKKAGA